MADESKIEETETPADAVELPDEHPGVEDGEIVKSEVPAEKSGGEVQTVEERIVYDYKLDADGNQVLDEDGNPIQVGWHKEPVNG